MEALHQPGDIITERYRITGTLGQGGIGITYAAEDLKSGQQVALKVLSLRQMGDWKTLELFEREAKILAQLNHPAIPRYLDYFQVDTPEDRGFYIAQELVEGKSLADLVKNGWRTNETGVRRIAEQVLSILVYLHNLKPSVVHRDIKPQNLIWGKDGKIFLVDFGAVQDTYRSTFAKGSTIVGTYGYMAPEQFRGQAVPATDLYGLGATVLFLLTHRSPSDLPQERLKINFRSRLQVSEGFADWLEKMLEPDAEERFTSAKEALLALQGRMVVAEPRRPVSWKALVGVGVVGVVAVTVLNSYKWTVLSILGFQPSGICEAASSRRIDIVRDYLKHGGDLNAKDNGELPILPCLLEMRNATKDIAELVIAGLPDVNAKNDQGKTPLHMARSPELVALLIAKGANVNAKDSDGNTPLDRAFEYTSWSTGSTSANEINLLNLLIAKGSHATKINVKNQYDGKTLLHKAPSKHVAELLIAQGADVNTKGNDGNSPLHEAASHGTEDLAELLIAQGADINAKNKEGNTPLHEAASYGKNDLADLLIAKGANINAKNQEGWTPLHSMARFANAEEINNLPMAQLLIAHGADINAKDNDGATPLHRMASIGWQDMAKLLIAKGAEVNARDGRGYTPLHRAAVNGSKDVVELLITKGADVKDKDKDKTGGTPLHWAAVNGSKEVVELLITKGADVNDKDNGGYAPLYWAIVTDQSDMTGLLLAKGAQINSKEISAKGERGHTLLHWAVAHGRKELAELLIAKGLQVNVKTQEGHTPLHYAAIDGYKQIAELLLAKGARVNDRDNEGHTPLKWAAECGNTDIVELLKSHGGIE